MKELATKIAQIKPSQIKGVILIKKITRSIILKELATKIAQIKPS